MTSFDLFETTAACDHPLSSRVLSRPDGLKVVCLGCGESQEGERMTRFELERNGDHAEGKS